MSGALTAAQILEIWLGAVDETYSSGFIEAGEGNGLEVYTQVFEQFARVSKAIDISTQALYIVPWSGQTNPPAEGESFARVTLTLTRTGSLHTMLCFKAGQLAVEEEIVDWGSEGGQRFRTGRLYLNTQTIAFLPGETGPLTMVFQAQKPGYGYNNPLPQTIVAPVQFGAVFENDGASIALRASASSPVPAFRNAAIFTAQNDPDVPIPEHIGQYYRFTNGLNSGAVGRVTKYSSPTLVGGFPIDGGIVEFALEYAFNLTGVVGSFVIGELVKLETAGVVSGWAEVLAIRSDAIAVEFISGVFGADVRGDSSGALATLGFALGAPTFVSETGTAEWRVLQWGLDWGLSITNELSPVGGRLGMLDLLGADRGIYRAPNEPDSSYRPRVWNIADTVAPNAIERALNRVLGPAGITHSFREVGRAQFPGLFFDAGGSAAGDDTHPPEPSPNTIYNFAYDMDFDARPQETWKVYVDLLEMRGFFVVGFKKSTQGLFGFFYDGTTADAYQMFNAYDRIENNAPIAYDGYALQFSEILKTAYDAVASIKAGGVGYEFVIDPTL